MENILVPIIVAVGALMIGWVCLFLLVGSFLPLALKIHLYRYIGAPFRLLYRAVIMVAWLLGEAVLVLGEKLLIPALIVIGRRLGAAWTTSLVDYLERRAAERAAAEHFRRWETERPWADPRNPRDP